MVAQSEVQVILRAGESVSSAKAGEHVEVICKRTPFYAESGGQTGDVGTMSAPNGELHVLLLSSDKR